MKGFLRVIGYIGTAFISAMISMIISGEIDSFDFGEKTTGRSEETSTYTDYTEQFSEYDFGSEDSGEDDTTMESDEGQSEEWVTVLVADKDYSYAHGYYYQYLTGKERIVYDEFVEACENFMDDAIVDYITVDEYINVYDAFRYDHPEFYWVDFTRFLNNRISYFQGDGYCKVYFNVPYDAREVYSQLLANADNIVYSAYAYANGCKDEYLMAKYFFDYLSENNRYGRGAGDHNQTATGALVYGESVCAGYADAFKLLCDRAGIDCITVVGYTLDEDGNAAASYHAWNQVSIYGQSYWVDATWGDSEYRDNYLISCPDYSYFLATDVFLQDHVADGTFHNQDMVSHFCAAFPQCSSMQYEFYNYNGMFFNTYSESEYYIYGNLSAGSNFIWMQYSSNEELSAAIDELINYGKMWKFIDASGASYSQYSYSFNAQFHTLRLEFM